MIKSYAKINLGLSVFPLKYAQQKHQLKSLFIKVKNFYDEIYINNSNQLQVKYLSENQEIIIENDIVSKAVIYLNKRFNLQIKDNILIIKHIPQQAGLGGSSSNAGYVIRFYIKKYNLKLSYFDYLDIAINIGSDVNFFIFDYDMAIVSGFGNIIDPVFKPIPNIEIISTPYRCSTEKIFKEFDKFNNNLLLSNDFNQIIQNLSNLNNCIIINDLEKAAFSINPKLKKYKKNNTLMTGSGSYFIKWKDSYEG